MSELLILVAIVGVAWALGRCVMDSGDFVFETGSGRIAAASSIGLGLIAYLILAIGVAGCLNITAVLVAGTALLVLLHSVWFIIRRLRCSAPYLANPCEPNINSSKSGFGILSAAAFMLVACLGSLICALAPPTAGDALCYHLEIPKRFVQLGSVCFLPLTDNSLFPFLMEMLYTLGLLLSGPVLAQLIHWLVGVLFAISVAELASPIVGRSGGWWAAAVALLVPGVTNQMTAPLNDLAVALFSTQMLIAWTRWNATRQNRWLVLAGVFGGLGMSVKLVTGAIVVVLLVAMLIHECKRQSVLGSLRAAAIFACCVIGAGGTWYARSWYHLGNPIYPYFNQLFGLDPHTRSMMITSTNPLTLPWVATMHPEDFGGRGVQFGAVFLALMPGLSLLPRRASEFTRLLLVALGVCFLWFMMRQELRFLLPVVPIFSVAVIAVVKGLREVHRPGFVVASSLLLGLMLFQTLIVAKRARPCLAVALSRESREAYLKRHEPSFRVAEFVNTQLPPGSRLISQDFRGLYFEPDFVREACLRRRVAYLERGDELVKYLAASRFTHVLLVQSHNPATAVYDQSFPERLGEAAERLPVVMACRFEGPGGDRREYKLLELPNAIDRAPVNARELEHRAIKGTAN